MLRLLALLVFCAALGWAVDTQVQLAEQAELLLRAKDAAGALAVLDKASEATSTAAGEDRIGFLYAVAGHQDEAASHFRKALALNPQYAAAHYHFGVLLWLAKDQERGLSELQAAAQLEPKAFDYRYRLGSAYVEMGSDELAVSELKAAVALDATKAQAWQQLGLAEQRTNDLGNAVKAYAKAVELNPKDDALRNAYATLLVETRQPKLGIQEAQNVLAHNKADMAAEMNIGYAYLKMGEFAKSEEAYRAVVGMDAKSPAAHYDLAIALKMQDELEAAQKEFERAIELAPDLAEAHYSLGMTDWQLGDFAATIAQMKAALAIRGDYAEAHYMLGIALKQSGDLDQAIVELKEAIRLDPSTPGPFNTLGQILRIKGDKQGSEEAFATGAKLKREKESQLANTLDQGMRGGEMPKPISGSPSH